MQLRTTLFLQLIIWQFANYNAQSTITKGKQDLSVVDVTENISTNISWTPQPQQGNEKSFYRYEPDTFKKNQSARMQLQQEGHQPRVLTEKLDIEIDAGKSVEKLKQVLMKFNYKPVVLLVDDTAEAFRDAVFFTEGFFRSPTVRTEFWLMVFNASGVSTPMSQSRTKPEEIITQLRIGEKNTKQNLQNTEKGSAMFFALLKAAQILPSESAIILFTNQNSIDENLAQLSVNYLSSKLIQLNVVWGGTIPSKGREEKLLEEAVLYTNGLFLLGLLSDEKPHLITNISDDNTPRKELGTKEIIVLRKNLQAEKEISFPIDRTVRNIYIIIEGNITSAILNTPSGTSVDLLDVKAVRRVLSASASTETEVDDATNTNAHAPLTLKYGLPYVYVRFNTAKVTTPPVIGVWMLRVRTHAAHALDFYNVTVYADTEMSIGTEVIDDMARGKNKEIRLKLNNEISKIENISFVDKNGQQIKLNLKSKDYILNDDVLPKQQIKLAENIKENEFYVEISGTNKNGEKFSRLSYVNQNGFDTRRMPMILIELSPRSELLVTPGSNPKIIFQVTNNYDYPVRIPFSVSDEKRMLRSLYPEVIVIGSKQSAEITVITTVPPSTSVDFTNQVTLTAYSTEKAQKVAIMYVTSTRIRDDNLPRIDYKFNSNCMEVPYSACQATYWTLELTAQDSQSGLMQVNSIPPGIYSPNGYVAGTKEPVHFYYTANCCQPETEIIAIDLSGNRRSFKVDANHANLSSGAIAAIVLGALIILALVILLIIFVTKKCRKRDSLDLPRYRGQATSSTRF